MCKISNLHKHTQKKLSLELRNINFTKASTNKKEGKEAEVAAAVNNRKEPHLHYTYSCTAVTALSSHDCSFTGLTRVKSEQCRSFIPKTALGKLSQRKAKTENIGGGVPCMLRMYELLGSIEMIPKCVLAGLSPVGPCGWYVNQGSSLVSPHSDGINSPLKS